MTLRATVLMTFCPSCGEIIVPSGITCGKEPDHLATTCPSCGKLIEAKADPDDGALRARVAKPS